MNTSSSSSRKPDLGSFGIWAVQFRFGDPGFIADCAAEAEELGYGALWFPGGRGGDLNRVFLTILQATRRTIAASGILNIWMHEPAEVGSWRRAWTEDQRARALLGLGVGHALAIGEAWKKPLEKMSIYLDGLDAEGVPAEYRCIAALGPKMMDLARDRTAGAHPYLVPPEHTALARERMGPQALIATEQGAIFDVDPSSARAKARAHLETYAVLPNYIASWKRLGFTDEDIATRSDRLVDGLFVWGSPEQIGARLKAHLDAGADHVAVQVVAGPPGANDLEEMRQNFRDLAPVLASFGGRNA